MSLTSAERERYARHILLKEIGGPGQQRLKAATIAIVGIGGLGAPAALYLAAAGVGRLRLIDDDAVALSNLQRQVLYATQDVGAPKVERAAVALKAINPNVEIEPIAKRLAPPLPLEGGGAGVGVTGALNSKVGRSAFSDASSADGRTRAFSNTSSDSPHPLPPPRPGEGESALSGADIVLDGTDDFATRFAVNAECHQLGVTLISGAVGRWEGQVATFKPDGPCYRCLVPEIPPNAETCAQVGIVGALTGVIGSMMALEAIKEIAGAGESLAGRLWLYDALNATSRTVTLSRDPACPVCGHD